MALNFLAVSGLQLFYKTMCFVLLCWERYEYIFKIYLRLQYPRIVIYIVFIAVLLLFLKNQITLWFGSFSSRHFVFYKGLLCSLGPILLEH